MKSTFEIVNERGTKMDKHACLVHGDGIRFDSLAKAGAWVNRMLREERIAFGERGEWYEQFAVQAFEYPARGLEKHHWRYTRKGWALMVDRNGERVWELAEK